MAYPTDKLKECILGVKQSPILVGVPNESVKNFCDCTLKLIIDEKIEKSAASKECGHKSFR